MSIGSWYRAGSVAVTNGSANVVGTSTFWTSQVNLGDRFTVDGENWYEIITITDDTHMSIQGVGASASTFQGTTASGAAYAVDRNFTNNLNANIAASVASLIAQYQANTAALGGKFLDGSAAAPGIAFSSETSTGLFRVTTGEPALAIQGAEVLRFIGPAGGVPMLLGIGTTTPANPIDLQFSYNALYGVGVKNSSTGTAARAALIASNGSQALRVGVNGSSFTTSGVLSASRGFVEGPNGVDFASGVTSGTAFSWGTGSGYTSAMTMDYAGNVELVTGNLGIGMVAANVLDITQTQNAASILSLLNSSSGTAAQSDLQLSNGTSTAILAQYGASFTTSGMARQNGTALKASGAGGLTLLTTAAQPIYIGINNAQVAEFDAGGRFGIGVTPSPWAAGWLVSQLGNSTLNSISTNAYWSTNWYYDGASDKYIAAGNASRIIQATGALQFQYAPSGIAGAPITWSTAFQTDASGRLGVGVVPYAWGSSGTTAILDLGSTSIGAYAGGMFLSQNAYYSGASWVAKATGASSYYSMGPGTHVWWNAASASAGSNIAFTQMMGLDASGNLNIGATGYSYHTVAKTGAEGSAIFVVTSPTTGQQTFSSFAVASTGANSANSAIIVNKNSTTSRSINAAGSLNASGADYAEYRQLIASLYGAVAKGALLGYNAAGLMTNVFADVVGRVLPKSTNPSYVGNDTWGTEAAIVAAYGVAAPGDAPAVVIEPVAPAVVSDPGAEATEEEVAAYEAYLDEVDAYPAQQAAYAAYEAAETAYQARLTAFNAALETERVKWDRIALCGVVPVNVSGLTTADIGKSLVPAAATDGTITAVAKDLIQEIDAALSAIPADQSAAISSAVSSGSLAALGAVVQTITGAFSAIQQLGQSLKDALNSFGSIEAIGADGRPLINVKCA